MSRRRVVRVGRFAAVAAALAACGQAGELAAPPLPETVIATPDEDAAIADPLSPVNVDDDSSIPTQPTALPVTEPVEPSAVPSSEAPAPEQAPDPTPTPSGTPGPRVVYDTTTVAYGTVGGITLFHPSSETERIGFHESSHDGAQQQGAYQSAADPLILPTRERGTGDMTAADIAIAPGVRVIAPASGVVKRAGGYTLYCDHRDNFVVIAPDAQPTWEVKVLHLEDLLVKKGDRVEGGVTPIAIGPRTLPFRSQVDDWTAEPSWGHSHIEIVDPSIPDRPSPGGGCS